MLTEQTVYIMKKRSCGEDLNTPGEKTKKKKVPDFSRTILGWWSQQAERGMKMDIYCAFYDMDTNKVYAWQSDRSIVAIDCTAVENAEADNLYQRSELDYLIWNDPTAYAELILNGEPQEYLKTVTVYFSGQMT